MDGCIKERPRSKILLQLQVSLWGSMPSIRKARWVVARDGVGSPWGVCAAAVTGQIYTRSLGLDSPGCLSWCY
jgi:hypothetical protein